MRRRFISTILFIRVIYNKDLEKRPVYISSPRLSKLKKRDIRHHDALTFKCAIDHNWNSDQDEIRG